MLWKFKQIAHPLWKYLNQPLFNTQHPATWQVSLFWYAYKVEHLENCLRKQIFSESHYTQ
jgi:hypothetical protein